MDTLVFIDNQIVSVCRRFDEADGAAVGTVDSVVGSHLAGCEFKAYGLTITIIGRRPIFTLGII